MLEDGYSLLFSGDSWELVRAALSEGRPLQLKMADGVTLELDWQSEPALES